MEDRLADAADAEQKREKRLKTNEESLRELWDNMKRTNIRIIEVPEGEEREKESEKILQEIIVENFPNMGKESLTQIQEAQQVPYKINPRRNTPRHVLIKLATLVHCWWDCKLVQPLWKAVWRFLRKLKIELPFDPEIPLLGIYPEKSMTRKDTCTPMFIAALFSIAKMWKQRKCPSI